MICQHIFGWILIFEKGCEKMLDLEENSKKLQELKKRLEQIGDSL